MTASKTKRLLYFMSELEKGNDISKTDYLARFGISERTLKEDVSELKENLTELRPNMKVKYSRKYGSYHAQYEQGYGNLKYNQAVILSKILLESRALRKDEVAEIINIFVERAVDDKERRRIKRLTELELDSYQELKIYQEQDKSLLPAISAIFDAIVDQRPLSFSYRKPGEKVEEYKVFPISVIFDNHYFYCISYKLDDNLLVIISSLKSVISVWIVSKPFINLKMIWLSRSVQNKKNVLLQMSRCVIRLFQCFQVMSGLELPLSIKGFTVTSWNPIFQNLNYLRKALVMVLIRSVMRLKLLVY